MYLQNMNYFMFYAIDKKRVVTNFRWHPVPIVHHKGRTIGTLSNNDKKSYDFFSQNSLKMLVKSMVRSSLEISPPSKASRYSIGNLP